MSMIVFFLSVFLLSLVGIRLLKQFLEYLRLHNTTRFSSGYPLLFLMMLWVLTQFGSLFGLMGSLLSAFDFTPSVSIELSTIAGIAWLRFVGTLEIEED